MSHWRDSHECITYIFHSKWIWVISSLQNTTSLLQSCYILLSKFVITLFTTFAVDYYLPTTIIISQWIFCHLSCWRRTMTMAAHFITRIVKTCPNTSGRYLLVNKLMWIWVIIIYFTKITLYACWWLYFCISAKFVRALINTSKIILISTLKSIMTHRFWWNDGFFCILNHMYISYRNHPSLGSCYIKRRDRLKIKLRLVSEWWGKMIILTISLTL